MTRPAATNFVSYATCVYILPIPGGTVVHTLHYQVCCLSKYQRFQSVVIAASYPTSSAAAVVPKCHV